MTVVEEACCQNDFSNGGIDNLATLRSMVVAQSSWSYFYTCIRLARLQILVLNCESRWYECKIPGDEVHRTSRLDIYYCQSLDPDQVLIV